MVMSKDDRVSTSSEPFAPQRIFLVVGKLAPVGGVEQYLTDLACGLVQHGLSVRIFSWRHTPRPNQYLRRLHQAGVIFSDTPAWQALLIRIQAKFYLAKLTGLQRDHSATGIHNQRLLRLLTTAVRQERPDVIHFHRVDALPLLSWDFFRDFACIYTEHGWPGPDWPDHSRDIQHAERVIAVSLAGKAAIQQYWRCTRPVQIIPGMVLDPLEPLSTAGANAATFTYIGRLDPNKNVTGIVQAFAQLHAVNPAARLDIWGDGPDRVNIRQTIQTLGLQQHVMLRGSFDHTHLAAILADTDVVVLFSYSEGLPLALEEAMACARPVIASRVGGIPDLVQDGETGLLTAPGDIQALTKAMLRLAGDAALRQQMGLAARKRFLELGLSPQRFIEDHLLAYAEAMRGFKIKAD